jgi:hypothetical protein
MCGKIDRSLYKNPTLREYRETLSIRQQIPEREELPGGDVALTPPFAGKEKGGVRSRARRSIRIPS